MEAPLTQRKPPSASRTDESELSITLLFFERVERIAENGARQLLREVKNTNSLQL